LNNAGLGERYALPVQQPAMLSGLAGLLNQLANAHRSCQKEKLIRATAVVQKSKWLLHQNLLFDNDNLIAI
jgi:hypothetical protein